MNLSPYYNRDDPGLDISLLYKAKFNPCNCHSGWKEPFFKLLE